MIKLHWKHKWNPGIKVFLRAFRLFGHIAFFHLKKIKKKLLLLSFYFSLPFGRIVESLGISLSAVAAEFATLSFQYMLPTVIFTLTGSPLLLSALWNPEAVKQIVKWCVSTFRQRSNPEHFFSSRFIGFTPPAGRNINLDNVTKIKWTLKFYAQAGMWICGVFYFTKCFQLFSEGSTS